MTEAETHATLESVRIGHWSDRQHRTGCTVIVFPESVLTAVDARGGAPGTRETDVLAPANLVRRADAILLTGGSAFGLAAADGVMQGLRERGRGFRTAAGPVPIVPAAVLFDLANGSPVWPGAEAGRAALSAAVPVEVAERGPVGAGTGATVGKIAGAPGLGGIGIATVPVGLGSVTAIIAVNSAGVVDGTDPRPALLAHANLGQSSVGLHENTTIGAVVIDAVADAVALARCAIAAHDGLARMIVPCHTVFDGDTVFVSALWEGPTDPTQILLLSVATELAVEQAIREAVADQDVPTETAVHR